MHGLVFSKSSGMLLGFVDLGDVNNTLNETIICGIVIVICLSFSCMVSESVRSVPHGVD